MAPRFTRDELERAFHYLQRVRDDFEEFGLDERLLVIDVAVCLTYRELLRTPETVPPAPSPADAAAAPSGPGGLA